MMNNIQTPIVYAQGKIRKYFNKPKVKRKLVELEIYVQAKQKAFAVGSVSIFLTTIIACLINYYELPYWSFAFAGYVLLLEMFGFLIWLCLENRTLFGSLICGGSFSILGLELVATANMIDNPPHDQFVALLTQVGVLCFVFGAGVSLTAQLGVCSKKQNPPNPSL